MEVLSIRSLEKSFGDKRVLCGLDMSVPEGSVFGFVGRNGAGKTTTMKAVLGLLSPDGGEIFSICHDQLGRGKKRVRRHSLRKPRPFCKLIAPRRAVGSARKPVLVKIRL